MRLTWKDAYITLLAGAVGVALIAALLGYDWSLFASWRGAVGTVSALGILMLLPEENDLAKVDAWGLTEWALFVGGIGLAIAGLIENSKTLFIILVGDVLAFWLVSLTRHLVSRQTRLEHRVFK